MAQTKVYTRASIADRYMVSRNGCWIWHGHPNPDGYGQVWSGGKRYMAHRLLWEMYRGPIGKGMQIDHLCHVKNCVNPEHLRECVQADNLRYRQKFKKPGLTSKYKGVHMESGDGRFVSKILVRGKVIWLGKFASDSEAAQAYNCAAMEHFGEFAFLNNLTDSEIISS